MALEICLISSRMKTKYRSILGIDYELSTLFIYAFLYFFEHFKCYVKAADVKLKWKI